MVTFISSWFGAVAHGYLELLGQLVGDQGIVGALVHEDDHLGVVDLLLHHVKENLLLVLIPLFSLVHGDDGAGLVDERQAGAWD